MVMYIDQQGGSNAIRYCSVQGFVFYWILTGICRRRKHPHTENPHTNTCGIWQGCVSGIITHENTQNNLPYYSIMRVWGGGQSKHVYSLRQSLEGSISYLIPEILFFWKIKDQPIRYLHLNVGAKYIFQISFTYEKKSSLRNKNYPWLMNGFSFYLQLMRVVRVSMSSLR